MGVQPGRRGAQARKYGLGSYSVGVLFASAVLSMNGAAKAQYIGQPTVFNGPIAPAPAPTNADNGPVGPVPQWLFTPAVTVGETVTDNVNLAPPAQARADLVTTLSPSL